MVASSSTDYQESMPVDVDRVQDVKGKGKKGNHWAKLTMPKEKERKEKENSRKERKVITRAKVRAKTRKEKVWQLATLVDSPDVLLETAGGYSTGCK